jgi:hypothetical protein
MTDLVINKIVLPPNIISIKRKAYKCYKEGMRIEGYIEHLNKKIELENKHNDIHKNSAKVFRYKDITMEEMDYLKNNFKRLIVYHNIIMTKKNDNILFKKKQKKNYNLKKNEIIETFKIHKFNELENLSKNKFRGDKNYQAWVKCYNLNYQYNKIVPNTFSKESLRKYVMN